MRISDWSADVCSSVLAGDVDEPLGAEIGPGARGREVVVDGDAHGGAPVWSAACRSRSTRRRILPVAVIGRVSRNSTLRGYSWAASRRLTCSWFTVFSPSPGHAPSASTPHALTAAVRNWAGQPSNPP